MHAHIKNSQQATTAPILVVKFYAIYAVQSFVEIVPWLLTLPRVSMSYIRMALLETFFSKQRTDWRRNDNPTVVKTLYP